MLTTQMKLCHLVMWHFVVCSAFAQGRWTKLEPPTASNLYKVCFIDSVQGWVAGDSGTILKTSDGGQSWRAQNSGSASSIRDLFVLDQSFGWALALEYPQDTSRYGTVLLKTTSGGSLWTSQSYGTRALYDISFADTDTGIAVGPDGTILRTSNGGVAWTLQTSGTTAWLHGVFFVNANTGTAVGTGGTILHTTNGGSTWTRQSSGTMADLLDVCFANVDTGTAVGTGGTILRTTNGGALWALQTSGTTARLEGVSFVNARRGTVAGTGGTVLRTTNGGTLWTLQTSGTGAWLKGVAFVGPDTGTVVGTGGTVLHTTNGGSTWTRQSSGTNVDLLDVSFTSVDTGTAVGNEGTIVRTTNGGATWTIQWTGAVNTLYGVCFTDGNTGTVVGQNGIIFRTVNGGIYWIGQEYPVSFFYYAIFFFDSLNGLMGGDRGKILRTTDGGATWFPAVIDSSIYTGFPVLHFDFTSRNYGFALGGRMDIVGIVWKTTNGGERWSASGPAGEPIHALHFIDSLNLLAVGGDFDYGSGMIRSKNGGLSWEYTYLGIWGEARALSFRTPSEGYAPLGFTSTYMMTKDTGTTWSSYFTPDSSSVYDVVFTDSIHGYMVGAGGTIFKYDPTIDDVGEVSTAVPTVPILYQNYPNPFNPKTNFNFRIPSTSHVTLKVYDVLGREVGTLVDGIKVSGEHSVLWDASGAGSGVYFYRLMTNGVVRTRKLVLLR